MPPVEFEPTILVSERPQIHALDRTATGIGIRTPNRPAPRLISYNDYANPAPLCRHYPGLIGGQSE
jgi:hypothetical protein